jgi:hypothetical protein
LNRLSSLRALNGVPTQSSFEFQEGQRYLKQPFSELLIGNIDIRTVLHERGRERARRSVAGLNQPLWRSDESSMPSPSPISPSAPLQSSSAPLRERRFRTVPTFDLEPAPSRNFGEHAVVFRDANGVLWADVLTLRIGHKTPSIGLPETRIRTS